MKLVVKPAGSALAKAEKRAVEAIFYTLDCSELLDTAELIVKTHIPSSVEGISLSDIRPRKGRSIEVKVSNAAITTAAYLDYTISILFDTTLGNTKAAVFQVRAHK